MADPATIALAVKTAVLVATDKRTWKVIGVIIAAILTPFILIIVMITSMLSGTANHNNAAIDLTFNGGVISQTVPEDYRIYIDDMRNSFDLLDDCISEINAQAEDEKVDSLRVKSIFYSLFFGVENPSRKAHSQFADCFVTYEERTRTTTHDDGSTTEENYTVAVPIKDMSIVYANIAATGTAISYEHQINGSEIYHRILYGGTVPDYGGSFDDWSNGMPISTEPFVGIDGFCSPLGSSWRSLVTSEFGWRTDPFTGKGAGHGGLDMGAAKGTQILAALDGMVQFVRHSSTGYGYHLAIDHGGGFITLYAHNSKILVTEGQFVSDGTVIAEVGSTGRSTGNHLHFEVRTNGEKQNPRNYLP